MRASNGGGDARKATRKKPETLGAAVQAAVKQAGDAKPKKAKRVAAPTLGAGVAAAEKFTKQAANAQRNTNKASKAAVGRSDVRSSGGDYGMKRAERYAKRQAANDRGDARAQAEQAARLLGHAPRNIGELAAADAKRRFQGDPLEKRQAKTAGLATIPPLAANLDTAKLVEAINKKIEPLTKTPAGKAALKVGEFTHNAVTDLQGLTTGWPGAMYHMGDTLVHDPKKVPGMLAKPYTEMYHHPGREAFTRPVSSVMALTAPAKAGSFAAGKGLRLADKQTLVGEARVLPGTVFSDPTPRPRGAIGNQIAKRKDDAALKRSGGKPLVASATQVQKRVDESKGAERRKTQRIKKARIKKAYKLDEHKDLSRKDRAAAIEQDVKSALASEDVKKGKNRAAVEEFGINLGVRSTNHPEKSKAAKSEAAPRGPKKPRDDDWFARMYPAQAGPGVEPFRNARPKTDRAVLEKGPFYSSKGAAEAAKARYQKKHGEAGEVVDVGNGEFGVMPTVVTARRHAQDVKGNSKSGFAVGLKSLNRAATHALLPLSPSFHIGNTGEAVVRAALAGAGPSSYTIARRAFKDLNSKDPKVAAAARDRILTGGVTGGTIEDLGRKSVGQQVLEAPDPAQSARIQKAFAGYEAFKQKMGLKAVGKAYEKSIAEPAFGTSAWIERQAQLAHAGKHLKQNHLESAPLGLSKKSRAKAAEALSKKDVQILASRQAKRDAGQYADWSPLMRDATMHWSPFLPWTLNSMRFLRDQPKHHPVTTTGLVAATNASRDWREKQGVKVGEVPPWLLTALKVGEDQKRYNILSKITPAQGAGNVLGDPLGTGVGLLTPGIASMLRAGFGINYKGQKLPKGTSKLGIGALDQAETVLPILGPVDRVLGAGDKWVRQREDASTDIEENLKRWLLGPVLPMKDTKSKRKAKRKKKSGNPLLSNGGSSSGKNPLLR